MKSLSSAIVLGVTTGFAAATIAAQIPTPPAKPPLRFPRTSQRIARGKYLVDGPGECFDCHADRDDLYARPVRPKPGRVGAGRTSPPPPGSTRTYTQVFPNITPDVETGSGSWGDDLMVRAIRRGIGHDDRVLWDRMPYQFFNALTDEDVTSIVVYLRTIPPVRNPLPKMILPDTLAARLHPMPDPAGRPALTRSTAVARGEYLATIGHCSGCHTPARNAAELPGMRLAGGATGFQLFLRGKAPVPVASANITQSPSGIPYYDESVFIKTIRTGAVNGVRELSTDMPWSYFRHMTDADLKDVFAYLRSTTPVNHHVSNTDPPALCPVCGFVHGQGDKNLAPGAAPAGK